MSDLKESIGAFGGTLLVEGDEGYDEARSVFNGMLDGHPALIARCTSTSDVVAAVKLAGSRDLTVAVYGGGHGVTGAAVADGAVTVDLRGMKGITVDPATKTARVEAGCTWGEVDVATQEHALAVTGGRVSTTGVSGLALGSGSGWLERSFGFVCDNLMSAEVVTADGREVVASPAENADLFWGLRGGGGNFGIVTAFHLQLHDLGPIVLGGMLMYPAAMGSELVRFYRDFMEQAPDTVGTGLAFICAPPEEFVPEPVRGQPVIGVIVCCSGSVEAAEVAMRPLREFGPPAVDMVQPMPYLAVQQLLDPPNPHGMRNYWTADFYDELPDAAVDALVAKATQPVSPMTQIILVPGGGAIARVDDDATAFGQRHSKWNIHFLSMWPDPSDDERNITYTRELSEKMKSWAAGEVYLNFIGDEGPDRVRSAFGPEKFARLQALKGVWDPQNRFRHNQNIPPS